MLAATLTLSVVEIIVLLFGAIILGITIHFFIASRKSLSGATGESEKSSLAMNEWKLKYFNDMEVREKEIGNIKSKLQEAEENASIFSMEAEEMRRYNKQLKAEAENTKLAGQQDQSHLQIIEQLKQQNQQLQLQVERADKMPAAEPVKDRMGGNYLDQLRQAQVSLVEQNQKINQLLESIGVIKEQEEIQQEMLRTNEELAEQVDSMRELLAEKENEINNIRQKEHLTKEMSSMLDHAYNDFNMLQSKISTLESQLTSSKMNHLELEDMKETYSKAIRDQEEQKQKAIALADENQDLKAALTETEDALREANFQRTQLQKKVAYLEELNHDLQVVSDANKKLEGQLRRIGELESMLNMVSEERDRLMQRGE